jgi:hypothetical protein
MTYYTTEKNVTGKVSVGSTYSMDWNANMRGYSCYRTLLEALDNNPDCQVFLRVEIGESYMNNHIVTNQVTVLDEIQVDDEGNASMLTGRVLSRGTRKHYVNGKLHRSDGPALECLRTGTKVYYEHGRTHRDGGRPAYVAKGRMEYWVNGVKHRVDGPAVVTLNEEIWYVNGEKHREDGPAYVNKHGLEEWYTNGVLQRTVRRPSYDSDRE